MSINNAQRTNNQANPSVVGKRQLREEKINPKDLAEVRVADLERSKNEGISIDILAPKQKSNTVNSVPEDQQLDFRFAPPKKGYMRKDEVFLPKQGEVYDMSSLTKKLPFHKILSGANLVQASPFQQAPIQYVVQSAPQNIHYQHPNIPTSVTKTKRIIHKLNGEIIEEEG